MPKISLCLCLMLALSACGGPEFLPMVETGTRPSLVPLSEITGTDAPATAAD